MARRIGLALVLLAVLVLPLAFWAKRYLAEKALFEAATKREAAFEQTAREATAKMVSDTNAIVNWEKAIQGEGTQSIDLVLSSELERQWVGERPILFIGSINDVASLDDTHYVVTIEREEDVLSFSSLALSVRCTKSKMDLFLQQHREVLTLDDVFERNYVAVVARIRSISATDERRIRRIGHGELLDLVYIGNHTDVAEQQDHR